MRQITQPYKRDTKPYIEGGESDIRHGKKPYTEGSNTKQEKKKDTNNNYITTTTKITTTHGTELDQNPTDCKNNHSSQCPDHQKI